MAGWVEERGNGRWRLNVSGGTGPTGKRVLYRKVVTATSRREAEKLLALFAAEVLKGEYAQPARLTLAQFADRWLKTHAEPHLAVRTVARYRELLQGRILPALGHLRLGELKPVHLVEFYRQLQETHRMDGKGILSDNTVHHHHRVLSAMLSKAVEWGLIASNPTTRVKPPRKQKAQARYYDEKQTAALLTALEQAPLKYRVMVWLTLALGLREGELMGLEWGDVDFEGSTITVRRAAQYVAGVGSFTKEPKTDTSKRVVAVPVSVMRLLQEYRREWVEHRLLVGDKWQGTERLFATFDGRPMHPYTPGRWLTKFLARHGLPHLPFHGLRHTAATLLIAGGVPLKNVSARLGHARLSTTADIYTHALQSVDRMAADAMDRILTGREGEG